jgi:preprotein translocase subunit SecB
MKNAEKSSFDFEGFKIIRSLFERKEGELGKNFNIKFQPTGVYHVNENLFQLKLGTSIINDSSLLNIEIEAIANFKIHGENSDKMLNNFFYLNAPAILFPYIRAYVSSLTTLSGISSVNLPTLNLSNLAAELEQNTVRIDE